MARGTTFLIALTGALMLLGGGILAASAAGEGAVDAETGAAPEPGVWVRDGELTVDVHNARLADIVHAIGAQAGVPVTIRGALDTPVTRSFRTRSVEDGIRRLVRGYGLAFTYSGSGPERVLAGVWIGSETGRRGPAAASTRGVESIISGPTAQAGGAPDPPTLPSTAVTADAREGDTSAPVPLGDRIAQIQALTEHADRGSSAALASLTEISASEPSEAVRLQAVAALGRLRGAAVEQALTEAMSADDPAIRVRAVRGLRGTGTDTSVASLARASTDDADPEVRLAALSALMSFPGHTMVQGLARAVADPDGRVRDAAFRGLTWWNARRSGAPVDDTNATK